MISVIIPVYNCENTIDQLLNSIWNQTFQNVEVICVNDGSTDGSYQKLQNQKKNHSNLVVITTDNKGPSVARNIGIDAANGQYVCFIDADDEIEDCYLADLYETMTQCEADLAVCHIDRVYDDNPGFLQKRFNYIQNYEFEGVQTISSQRELLVYLLNAPFAKLIRKEFLDIHQIRFVEGKIAQDLLFTKTMLLHEARTVCCPRVNYHYHVRKGTITTGRLNKALDLADVYDELILVSKKLNIFDLYFPELEYLCVYHLGIDMAYRYFRANHRLLKSLSVARKHLRKYGFSTKNKYCQDLNWFVRLYLMLL